MSSSKLTSVLPNNSIKGAYPRHPVSTVYVENSNNKSTLEDIMYVNDVELGFQNAAYGGNSIFRFPRTYQFIGPVLARFTIAYSDNDSHLVKEDYIAYNLIRRIRWTVGGTELLSIDGENLVDIVLQQCESHMKKAKVLECAGQVQTITGANQLKNKTITYECLIPCPWSSLKAKCMNTIRPFPLHMLSEPVELQIELRQQTDVFGVGAGGTIGINGAQLLFSYGKLGSMEQMKNQVYRWPFTSVFSHRFNIDNKTTDETVTVDLNGFRKGEVKEIQLHGITNTQNTAKQIYSGQKLNDIQLLFNGQVIWQSNNTSQLWDLVYNREPSVHGYRRLQQLAKKDGDQWEKWYPVHKNQTVAHTGTVSTDALENTEVVNVYGFSNRAGYQEKYYYNIPIAECLDSVKKSPQGHVLGADFTKQTIQLRFKGLGEAGKLFVGYYYNAMYQLDGESALLVF